MKNRTNLLFDQDLRVYAVNTSPRDICAVLTCSSKMDSFLLQVEGLAVNHQRHLLLFCSLSISLGTLPVAFMLH